LIALDQLRERAVSDKQREVATGQHDVAAIHGGVSSPDGGHGDASSRSPCCSGKDRVSGMDTAALRAAYDTLLPRVLSDTASVASVRCADHAVCSAVAAIPAAALPADDVVIEVLVAACRDDDTGNGRTSHSGCPLCK
jgi:hypothetical protein